MSVMVPCEGDTQSFWLLLVEFIILKVMNDSETENRRNGKKSGTWLVFTSVLLIWIVVNFMEYRQLLVLLSTGDLDGKSRQFKYDSFELKWIRSECRKVSSLSTCILVLL